MPRAEDPAAGPGTDHASVTVSRRSMSGLMAGPEHLASDDEDLIGDLISSDRLRHSLGGSSRQDVLARLGLWVLVVVLVGTIGTSLWYGLFIGFFGGVLEFYSILGCESAFGSNGRAAIHWFIGWAPGWARSALLVAFAGQCCRKIAGVEGQGLTQALFLGVGQEDGRADSAGWLSIVGGHPDRRNQSTWQQARNARSMSKRNAYISAAFKLIFWHWIQPVTYLFLLAAYRCFVSKLGTTQQYLAALVAAREVVYFVTTLVAVWFCPVFLLLDLRTLVNEAANLLEVGVRLAMYFLCPHNYVALCLANHLPRLRKFFICVAAIQIYADLASCYALVNLLAGGIEVGDSDNVEYATPLTVGYSITAFGFLLFFGPLSVATSFESARNKRHHFVTRAIKGLAGLVLLFTWICIMVMLCWLVGGGNPFCSASLLPFLSIDDPCSGHGQCYGASQCRCDKGFGPESKLAGDALCSCPVGWAGASCNKCRSRYIGAHCSAAFNVSGAVHNPWKLDGVYERTDRNCQGYPVYQNTWNDSFCLYKPDINEAWVFNDCHEACHFQAWATTQVHIENPDGKFTENEQCWDDPAQCVTWAEAMPHGSTIPCSHRGMWGNTCISPRLLVRAIGGAGCEANDGNSACALSTPTGMSQCVGREASQPYLNYTCLSVGPRASSCWYAETSKFPHCSDYKSAGYTCVAVPLTAFYHCAAIDPEGTPSTCASEAPAGYVLDAATGTCVPP